MAKREKQKNKNNNNKQINEGSEDKQTNLNKNEESAPTPSTPTPWRTPQVMVSKWCLCFGGDTIKSVSKGANEEHLPSTVCKRGY